MSQLYTLFWLRFTIFKNSLTARGEVARRILNALLLIIPLLMSVAIGAGLFVALILVEQFRAPVLSGGMTTVMATLLFLMLVSHTTGSSSHFDPRRFTLFPIKLSKLYLLNLLSGLGEFSVLMIIPSMVGILLGLGVAYQHPLGGVLALVLAVLWIDALFICTGMFFAWLLSGRKRSREILFALLIGVITVGGQLLPRFFMTSYGEGFVKWLVPYRGIIFAIGNWTPIGIWSFFYTQLEQGEVLEAYTRLIIVNSLWTGLAWILGYLAFSRLALSAQVSSSAINQEAKHKVSHITSNLLTFRLPFFSGQASAVVAKELRYLTRNPATYLTILSALIFPLIFFRSGRSDREMGGGIWWICIWIGYVFMMNLQYFVGLFAYDAAGFRQYLLAPIEWRNLLLGKNAAICLMVTLQIGLILLGAETLDHNLTPEKLFVAVCALFIALAIYSVVGNYVSIYFPYRVHFGFPARRRENWSGINLLIQFALLFGVIGLLLLPLGLGYWFKSKALVYLVFVGIAVVGWLIYLWLLGAQGRLLEARRFDIAETLTRKLEKV